MDTDTAYFVNLADLHYGLNHRKFFLQNLEFLLSIPNLYFGLGGDCGNGVTRTSKGNPLEEWASGDQQLYALAQDLQPVVNAGKLLYIIEGNHMSGRMKDETFHTPEELLAWILGEPTLFKGSQVILYFNVRKNCYVHYVQHKSTRNIDTFNWINADVVWKEHIHQNHYQRMMVLEHNKFTKKPIVKETFAVQSGHWQVLPHYISMSGMRPTFPGCWITEMGGEKERHLDVYSNDQFVRMVQRGYQT